MGRYTGPVCRQCRREGKKLFLKGARCYMAKCPIEQGTPAPGMHVARRAKKMSEYGSQLRQKQSLRRQYGMGELQFRRFFQEALRREGITGEILLQMLEMRLDSVVYRLGLAPSRRAARQFIRHGHILVNDRKASIPSMIVRAYPTSNGSATNLVYVSVLVDSSSWTFLGISNGLKRIAISLSPC